MRAFKFFFVDMNPIGLKKNKRAFEGHRDHTFCHIFWFFFKYQKYEYAFWEKKVFKKVSYLPVLFFQAVTWTTHIFMPPTSKKLRGHIGLILSVCLLRFIAKRYLKNRLRYGVNIWYTVSLPYEDVLINF